MANRTGSPEEIWRETLVEGHRRTRMARAVFGRVPSAPRCKICQNPFGGVGGKVFSVMGFKPSRKNPNLCTKCCDVLPAGGAEVDTGILFADVRGSTVLGESMSATEYATLLGRFYKVATRVLVDHDAVIDKLIGDEVMAIFVRGMAGPEYRHKAAHAGIEIARSAIDPARDEPWLPVGVGVHVGTAFVGNVGGDGVVDFTALGDTVNVAARLQAEAQAREVVLSEGAFDALGGDFVGEPRTVAPKGKRDPLAVRVLTV